MPHMTYLNKTKHFMDMSVATKINFFASNTFKGSHKDFRMSTTHYSYQPWHIWPVMNPEMNATVFEKLEAKCKIQQEQEEQQQSDS